MQHQVKYYKRKFRNLLAPILVMLIDKYKKMSLHQWRRFVNKTMQSVQNNPSEYLGTELPGEEVRKEIIEELFHEFLQRPLYKGKITDSGRPSSFEKQN